ncbi:Entner-Doudoroff aldolase [Kribbella aluminosa]|uniref:Entner-Doudoroff aldolase n=1 Tax=Kribbella aluminosa TaxID=416017 RepID=A0ABS4UX20_9ACTN|nr:bifunctional 4-hydroxy-2-oxoglutarate aldolase/2-dehydro-3-deoxy-phosphogluconate aldolase [Kribbella aluminosa]MBP2356185.1 Entner-Doudoroff aldolase [Kribbella aluminosa]
MTELSMANADEWFDRALATTHVMAILRGFSPKRTVELAERAWAAGIQAVEVPAQGPVSLRALQATAEAARSAGAIAGAGTVVCAEGVAEVRDAGAMFTVAPGFDPVVSAASLAAGMPHLPGVATPTEVQRAQAFGHRWLKLFPASVLGVAVIAAMRGPFPEVSFVATGGVGVHNAKEFLDSGALAVSLGASFADAAESELADLIGRDVP